MQPGVNVRWEPLAGRKLLWTDIWKMETAQMTFILPSPYDVVADTNKALSVETQVH